MRQKLLAACVVVSVLGSGWASAEVLLRQNFEDGKGWTGAATDVMPSTPLPVETTIEAAAVGRIIKAGTSEASGGMLLTADVGDATGEWNAHFASGTLAVKNSETNLGKLTLAFDLSASVARPVTVVFESFDKNKKRTGGLETVIYPAAADFYLRYAVDLSTMKPAGAGKFNPADPFVQVSYVMSGPAFPSNAKNTLKIDNLNYSSPAYYVSPSGSDTNDGKTEKTAFATPQKAVDATKPGDIVLLMEGDYARPKGNTVQNGIMHIEAPGEPDAWIVFKNYPGHKPRIINEDSWCAIRIGGPVVRQEKYKDTPQAYIELRGLHVRGQADKVMEKYKDLIGLPRPETNGNGIGGPNVRGGLPAHHLRVADCIAEYNPGGGIGFSHADWVQFENNISRYNSWFTIYATSGMGSLGTENFDTTDNVYKVLYRNNRVSWNRTYIIWKQIGKVSDGNGIIIDTTYIPAKNEAYIGRTLIQNNIVTYNGGSGIHCFKAWRVDVVNNTAFQNGASPELRWGQIFFQSTSDAKMINNVLYARDGQPVNTVGRDTTDRGNKEILRSNNVYFGGAFKPIPGVNDLISEPGFVSPWVTTWEDGTLGGFKLAPESPARGHGLVHPLVPLTDIDGNPRPLNGQVDAGAYQVSGVKKK